MTYDSNTSGSSSGHMVAGSVGALVAAASLAYVACYDGLLPDSFQSETPAVVRSVDEAPRINLKESSDRLAAERNVILHRE